MTVAKAKEESGDEALETDKVYLRPVSTVEDVPEGTTELERAQQMMELNPPDPEDAPERLNGNQPTSIPAS